MIYFINVSSKIILNLLFATNRAIVSRLRREKESPDSTEHCTGEEPGISTDAEKYVEITDSATENNCLFPLLKERVGVRLKMWGKGPQLLMVTSLAGKPCKLKCHIYHRLRAARPMMEGRQIDPVE